MPPVHEADDPLQFVLDEETASHASGSSQTASLLGDGRPQSPPSTSSDEKQPSHRHPPPPGPSRVLIPTTDMLLAARGRRREGRSRWKLVTVGLLVLFLSAWGITALLTSFTRFGHGGPQLQVILMISDGMGPASETMVRTYLQMLHSETTADSTKSALNGSVWETLSKGFEGRGFGMTPLDEILVGASRTRSSSSLVTDSAAGATAFSCGLKTYNGAIGVDPSKAPCGTVLEAAKRQGFATGLVATSRITHATPASFYAHVVDRDLESSIANFLVGEGPQGLIVDYALGGGRCFFLSNSTKGSCRTDGDDLLAKAKESGVTVLQGMEALRTWHDESGHAGAPVLGLFADDHMDYEIDRQRIDVVGKQQPSLKEMATHALKYLSGMDGKGFFLMIEGSRIDMAGHNNDPVGHVSDMLAYLDTVQYVKQWVDSENENGLPTVLISVSDHETGGLSLARQLGDKYPEYAWYPDALVNATHSSSYLGQLVSEQKGVTRAYLRSEILEKGLGITDATSEEIDKLYAVRQNGYRANRVLADAISRRAQVGWATAGHSGVDVNLYAYGYNATGLAGNRENTEIGDFIAHTMGLNLEVVTLELNKNLNWHSTTAGKSPSRTTRVDHYHGDF